MALLRDLSFDLRAWFRFDWLLTCSASKRLLVVFGTSSYAADLVLWLCVLLLHVTRVRWHRYVVPQWWVANLQNSNFATLLRSEARAEEIELSLWANNKRNVRTSCFAVTTVRWCTPPSQLTFLPWAKAPSKPVGASRLRPKTSPYSSLDHTLVNTQYIYLC